MKTHRMKGDDPRVVAEYWWDNIVKTWTCILVDENGFQIGETHHWYTRPEIEDQARQLLADHRPAPQSKVMQRQGHKKARERQRIQLRKWKENA